MEGAIEARGKTRQTNRSSSPRPDVCRGSRRHDEGAGYSSACPFVKGKGVWQSRTIREGNVRHDELVHRAQHPNRLLFAVSRVSMPLDFATGHFGFSATLASELPSDFQSGAGALDVQLAFHLREAGHNVKKESTR